MEQISTTLALIEDYPKYKDGNDRQIRTMNPAPSVNKKNEINSSHSNHPILANFNKKSISIQYMLFSGIFSIVNSIYDPELTLQIIDATTSTLSNIRVNHPAQVWSQ